MSGRMTAVLALSAFFLALSLAVAADAVGPVTMEQAKAKALSEVPEGTVVRTRTKSDDGKEFFRIEIVDATYFYEFDINPATAIVMCLDRDPIVRDGLAMTPAMEQAQKKVLELSNGGVVTKIEQETKSGKQVLDIDVYNGAVRHEFLVDIADGSILKHRQEDVD